MTELHLARHGETVWHAENRYAGISDVALTDRGRDQGARLAEWAARAGVVRIVASPLARARETAALAGEAAGLAVQTDPRLREVDFGEGEGLTGAEMEAGFPAARAAFLAAPATSPLPGGEPGPEAAARFLAGLADAAAGVDGPVLVVAHSTVMRLALCRMLGLPLDAYRARFPRLGTATLTTVRPPQRGDWAGRTELVRFDTDPASL
jgi:broad specificity phosphatase PhoE